MLSVDALEHFIKNDIQFKLAFEVDRHEFVFVFDVNYKFSQTLVIDA